MNRPSPRAAVLGSPIQHSLSPVLHRAAYAELGLTWSYEAIEVGEHDLAAFLDSRDESWVGVSLTMPLKRAVLPLLDESSDLVQLVGAANTVLLTGDTRVGHNTDVAGVLAALREAGVRYRRAASLAATRTDSRAGLRTGDGRDPPVAAPALDIDGMSRAVIIGAGATAASALAAMGSLGVVAARVHARRIEAAEELAPLAAAMGIVLEPAAWPDRLPDRDEALLVVSTVPAAASAGLIDLVPERPGLLLDVAYDPWPPPLAVAWRTAGGSAVSGERMLLHQAVAQVRLMTGLEPDINVMDFALGEELARRHA